MILGPISYLDCTVFCIFLAPQLLIHVGLLETIFVVLRCVPFLLLELPYCFIYERYFLAYENQAPFVQQTSPFEDFVTRCVRYAFTNIPPSVGRVFFSKPVALPLLRFRMLRHGYIRSPVHWREHEEPNFRGMWVIQEPTKRPDICIYYAHGGGFSMGSTYFYLEFLFTWLDLLKRAGYRNPSIFALEYTLVPDKSFPKQLEEATAGYEHVLSLVGDAGKVCVSGDSAGATIVLSLLLHLAKSGHNPGTMHEAGQWGSVKPAMALLISPWVTLVSDKHSNTRSDYLDARNLHIYAEEYAGEGMSTNAYQLSPGRCRDTSLWRRASPSHGIFITYGQEEVFASDIREFVQYLQKGGVDITSREEPGSVHAWPVTTMFLGESNKRLKGLKALVQEIRNNTA